MKEALHLSLFGASHASAPLSLRQSVSLDPARKEALETGLLSTKGLSGFVVLNTCNRVELYLAAEEEAPIEAAKSLYSKVTGLDEEALTRYGYERNGCDAVRHLMEVSAGLDSEMIGETEILGQVKQAYQSASERGDVGPTLHRLFQKSFQAAKWAREHSGIGLGQVSLGAVAVELARRVHGDLSASRVLIVGSGQVGADVARALQLRGARDILVSSRTDGHADALASEIGARAVPFESWRSDLASCDIAILCTASPTTILASDTVKTLMAKRRQRPLFILDLAMPLDADPAIGKLPEVFLYTFADLAAAANENRKGRLHEVDVCRADLSERAERLWGDLQKRMDAEPADTALTSPEADIESARQ